MHFSLEATQCDLPPLPRWFEQVRNRQRSSRHAWGGCNLILWRGYLKNIWLKFDYPFKKSCSNYWHEDAKEGATLLGGADWWVSWYLLDGFLEAAGLGAMGGAATFGKRRLPFTRVIFGMFEFIFACLALFLECLIWIQHFRRLYLFRFLLLTFFQYFKGFMKILKELSSTLFVQNFLST